MEVVSEERPWVQCCVSFIWGAIWLFLIHDWLFWSNQVAFFVNNNCVHHGLLRVLFCKYSLRFCLITITSFVSQLLKIVFYYIHVFKKSIICSVILTYLRSITQSVGMWVRVYDYVSTWFRECLNVVSPKPRFSIFVLIFVSFPFRN